MPAAAERDVVIEWYSPLNFFLRQADIFRIRQPGTGRWFLETTSFKEWKSGVGKTLWCRGMPGAGKTVLVSIAVNHLRAEQEHLDTVCGIAAIYLNHKETDAHAPSTLLTSLWRQLVVGRSIGPVDKLYQKHREPCTKPLLNEDHTVLCSIISRYLKVFILVDALDEYPERERGILIWYLSRLGSNVNLLLTSRPHISLSSIYTAQLEVLEVRAMEEDIRCHIDAQILKSPRLSKHIQNCPELLEQIEEKIVRRSDGMFLMAKLHIESLAGKHTVKAVQDALKNLPNDLESTYDEVMERIHRQSDDDRNLALRTLSWISNAQRILRPSELRTALAVEPGTTELDPNNLLDMETILSVCAGLVLVDVRDNRLRLVHFTAQNYLERIQATAFPHASTQITTTCIEYLSFNIFLQKTDDPLTLFHKHSFLDYAVDALHAAASHGRRNIISLLLAHEVDIECRGPSGTALQVAAHFGQKESVEMLIACGADVNAPGGCYGPALYAAASRPAYDVFCQLVAAGADTGGVGLRMPSDILDPEEGGTAMAAVLIAGDGGIHNALQTALQAQNEATLRLLLAECNRGGDEDKVRYAVALSEPLAQGARKLLESEAAHRPANTLPTRLEQSRGLDDLQEVVPNKFSSTLDY
ncbi:hypothetical protein B0H12DRAFT_1023779 [Mycena haematopus]|nr:hypothetical protein B0H12DRAFT_1023779 [Mycena haematopus]